MISIPGYRFTDTISEGDKIAVYRGQRLSDGQPARVRAIGGRFPDPRDVARMRRDHEISSALEVPGVIRSLGLFPHQGGLAIVLEDPGAVELARATEQGVHSIFDFLRIGIQAAEILGQIHKKRIVHKNLHPGSILVHPTTGHIYITDFGISSTLGRENAGLLTPDQIEGQLPYIAPEQTGRMNRSIDYRSDFYSLGITLFEILTGRLPFESNDPMEFVHFHIARDLPQAGKARYGDAVPQGIQQILIRLTAKNPEDRYKSAAGLARDLTECLKQLQEKGSISNFTAGSRDFSDSFQIPQTLFGREKERDLLLSSYAQVCDGQPVLALISGRSGAGKTVLIHEMLRPMTKSHGYFTSGKFEAHKRDVPYSAFIDAFEELIRQLLTESKERLAAWKDQLVRSFGMNGQVLIDVIPDLQLIVGDQAPVPDLPPTEARNRFHLVFQSFVRVFATREHPLTLFLDDLQWTDVATLGLLKTLLTDPDLRHLFIVGSYRDNEVPDAHPLTLALEDLRKAGIKPVDLKLALLGPRDVRELVIAALALPEGRTSLADDLADAAFRKTDGNPFYCGEFLKNLHQDGLIFFDEENGHFTYDILKIRAQSMSDDLLRIIAGNIQHLSETGQDLIRMSACLGSKFDLRTLAMCMDWTQTKTAGEIEELLIEGLLVSLDDSYKYAAFSGGQSEIQVDYRFVHDQVHNAAYTLLNDDHRRQNHLRIDRTLLANLPFAERDDRILEITHHFNQGRELILDADERLRLIELNIQAGKKARDASAYEEALRLFGVAFDALPPDAAEKHYDIYMQVHRDLGEINYILNDPKSADKYFSKILEKAKSPLEKVRVYELKIAMSAGRGERAEAIRLGLEVLGLLGVKLTASPSASSVKAELSAADKSLSGKNPDRLVDLHLMEEESNKAAMRVLMQIATPAFAGNAPLFYSIIARMIQLSTKHGNAPASAYAYAAYGMILCGDGESERGYRIGRMALDLVEKLQARDLKCRVYFLYSAGVHHWKQHARESTDYLTHAYQAGLESGDLEYVAAVIFLLTASALWVGHKPLKEVLSDFDRFANPLYRTGQKQVIQLVQMGRQYISNLQGGSRNRTRLSGERFHEEETAEFWKETQYGDGLYYLNLFKTSLADMFGQYDQAMDFARKAEEHGELQKATLSHPALELHRGLSAGALAGQPKADRKKLLETFDASMSRMESFAKNSPDNFKHMHLMLRAERARLDARHGDAIPLYDEAIETARSQGFHLDEAHANELAASYFSGLGQRKFALLYVREARAIYGALDITAKVEEIENHFPELVRGSQMSGSGSLAQAGGFDFQTIVKAAASISGEIQLEGLLGKLLRIVMENAGAQKAHLLLDQDGAVVVSASGNALNDQVTPVPNVPLEDYNLLPHSIVLLAERTRTSIVVDEAASDSRFRADPYILEYKPRSVLCMPVVLQGKLSCILYLENNGAPGVFSPARLEALQVLSAQIATSLENAKLYSNLERALEQEKLARQAQVEINEAISRFVPAEFLKLLGKENIVGVSLGDNIAREMTVLFSDIRSFTSLSESMTPEQNFRFINSYLNQVGPVVREHHGFIDKYIGDAIMALFDSPDNALMSSIGMLRALEVWNHGRLSAGYAPVRTGIGLHTGDLMLGTIGEKSRMEGTVISDHVNLASRMEGLTKIYGTSLIISNRTQSLLKDPSRFSFRTLDRVQVKGKKEPVIVIEVLDGETDSVRQLKEASRAKFDEAQKLYLSQKFENARSLFIEVLKSNPDDRAAGIFVRRCRLYMEKGVPEGWNGVEQMTTK